MNGYLLCIIGTVLISSIITAIVPDGKTTAVIKGVAKLACLLAIIAPIPTFLQKDNFFDALNTENQINSQGFFSQTVIPTDGAFIQYYSETRITQTEKTLQEELYERFAVKAIVNLEWEIENECDIRITKIRVRIEKDVEREVKTGMSEYLTKNYCSEVLIE